MGDGMGYCLCCKAGLLGFFHCYDSVISLIIICLLCDRIHFFIPADHLLYPASQALPLLTVRYSQKLLFFTHSLLLYIWTGCTAHI